MFRSRPASLALVGLFLWAGCTSWQQIEIDNVPDYSMVRVTTTDGDEHRFREPVFVSDTLWGRVREDARPSGYRWSDSVTALPVEHIADIEGQKSNSTGYALLGVAGFAVLILVVAAAASGPFEF